MTNKIRNTTTEVHANPLAALFTMGIPGAIERSEEEGQRQLLASEVLPVRLQGSKDADFEALGFAFGKPVDGDDLFRAATLPTGWKREGSGHAMWSYINDERGLRRVSIFYKAAFYDRDAFMHLDDVGGGIGCDAIYGEGEPTVESLRLALLTDAERASLVAYIDSMQKRIDESPTIYGKNQPRLNTCIALLKVPA